MVFGGILSFLSIWDHRCFEDIHHAMLKVSIFGSSLRLPEWIASIFALGILVFFFFQRWFIRQRCFFEHTFVRHLDGRGAISTIEFEDTVFLDKPKSQLFTFCRGPTHSLKWVYWKVSSPWMGIETTSMAMQDGVVFWTAFCGKMVEHPSFTLWLRLLHSCWTWLFIVLIYQRVQGGAPSVMSWFINPINYI